MAVDLLDFLTKLVLRHENLTNVLAQGFAEHAELILNRYAKCGRCGEAVATVRHITLGLEYCDHCAACIINKARRSIGGNCDLNFVLMLGHVMDDEAWIDLPGAIGLRRAQDLVNLVNKDVEPDLPDNPLRWQ